ncbi:hypothetical protein QJQ45_027559, partial [Haematococcus lacustris]
MRHPCPQCLAAAALANLSTEPVGLEALLLDQDLVMPRVFAALSAAFRQETPSSKTEAKALLSSHHAAAEDVGFKSTNDAKPTTTRRRAAVHAARARCFAATLVANAMSHPVLSKAVLGQAGSATLATLLQLVLSLPSPRQGQGKGVGWGLGLDPGRGQGWQGVLQLLDCVVDLLGWVEWWAPDTISPPPPSAPTLPSGVSPAAAGLGVDLAGGSSWATGAAGHPRRPWTSLQVCGPGRDLPGQAAGVLPPRLWQQQQPSPEDPPGWHPRPPQRLAPGPPGLPQAMERAGAWGARGAGRGCWTPRQLTLRWRCGPCALLLTAGSGPS